MIQEMVRIQPILRHPLYRATLEQLKELERDRIYCRHGLPHLVDVARIAALLAADQGADFPRDEIYAAALLHDIGRPAQYVQGTDHAAAGMETAREILQDTAFTQQEQAEILDAVGRHRKGAAHGTLAQIICAADDASRMCFCCDASDTCYWPEERKNHTVLL